MKNLVLIVFAVLAISCTCGGPKKVADLKVRMFSVPSPPQIVESSDSHAEFYAKHFWDNMDFRDTLQIGAIDDNNIAYYAGVLRTMTLTQDQISSSINTILDRAEAQPAMYMKFVDKLDKYLYDPNSPLRHEENYIIVLNKYLESNVLSDLEKERYIKRLEMALKNRPGAKATNFTYTLADDTHGTLHGIKADFTLLFISNPGCPACSEITEALKTNPLVAEMVDNGQMKILVVYPDEGLDEWLAHRKDIPSNWINAYDKSLSIRDNELYDIKAIPTLYLLDKDKIVLIKDFVEVVDINNYFRWNPFDRK